MSRRNVVHIAACRNDDTLMTTRSKLKFELHVIIEGKKLVISRLVLNESVPLLLAMIPSTIGLHDDTDAKPVNNHFPACLKAEPRLPRGTVTLHVG